MKNSMINRVTLTLAAVALLAVAAAPLGAQTWKGAGLPDDPFLIESVEQLAEIAEEVNKMPSGHPLDPSSPFRGVHFLLTADLDMAKWNATHPQGWIPIGGIAGFYGYFDGGGHVIRNLYVDSNLDGIEFHGKKEEQGLFGRTYGATIENLGLIDVDVTGDMCVGALIGFAAASKITLPNWEMIFDKSTTITNCHVTGKVTGFMSTGGLVGYLRESIISSCFAACDVYQLPEVLRAATNCYKGVLVGEIYTSTVSDSYVTGSIQADNYATGGVTGAIVQGGNVYNCYATTTVHSDASAGGVVGYNTTGRVTNCVVLGEVAGVEKYSHPIVGLEESKRLLNNYVSEDILVNGKTLLFSDKNGAAGESVSADKLHSADFYTTPKNWSPVNADGGEVSTAWDLTPETSGTAIWNIWEGRSLPYFQYQSAPTFLTSVTAEAIAGEYRTDDRNDPESISVSVNGTPSGKAVFDKTGNWFYSFPAPLSAGDAVSVSVKEWGKVISYPVGSVVSLDGVKPTSPGGGTAIHRPLAAVAAEEYKVRFYSLTGASVATPVSGNVYIRKSVHPTLPARVEKIIQR
jgi:hypothetical protein